MVPTDAVTVSQPKTVVKPFVRKRVSLVECLEMMHETVILENDTAYHCSRCDRKCKAERNVRLNKLPPILMLTLQRFRGGKKNEDIVEFPLKGLDMSPYCMLDQETKDQHPEEYTYDLFGVINQIGSLFFGHYTAKAYNEEADSWYDFNDSTVTKMGADGADKDSDEYLAKLSS